MRTLRLSLAGTVILSLLGGLGGAVMAQDEEVAPAELPTGPALFEMLSDDGLNVVATDPRKSGKLVERQAGEVQVPGVGWVYATRPRLENDAGAWDCWLSEYGINSRDYYGLTWCVGEGAYEGLSSIEVYGPDKPPGLIYEGEPLWEPPAE